MTEGRILISYIGVGRRGDARFCVSTLGARVLYI